MDTLDIQVVFARFGQSWQCQIGRWLQGHRDTQVVRWSLDRQSAFALRFVLLLDSPDMQVAFGQRFEDRLVARCQDTLDILAEVEHLRMDKLSWHWQQDTQASLGSSSGGQVGRWLLDNRDMQVGHWPLDCLGMLVLLHSGLYLHWSMVHSLHGRFRQQQVHHTSTPAVQVAVAVAAVAVIQGFQDWRDSDSIAAIKAMQSRHWLHCHHRASWW